MPAAPTMMKPLPALAIGTAGVLVVTITLFPFRDDITRAEPALLLIIPVIGAGILGGRLVAGAVALEAAFAFASGFLPPLGSPRVELAADVIALVLFVVVAGLAGVLVANVVLSERRQIAADQARIDALEQADRQRSALLRSVSHDLRTPLATIRAVATDLDADTPFDPAVRQDLVGLVIDEAERLDRIVSNLLNMSRIEAGSFMPDRQAVEVGELVEACCARLARLLQPFHLQIDVEPDLPLAHLDYVQFDQVLSNLLENAARHSPEGGTVWVEVRHGPPLRLTVTDQGPGFDPAIFEHAFEPFASSGGRRSSGVGLAICRAIVEAHGGIITATNAPQGGARVTVEVPDIG